jgi:hypothetical protein
MSLAAERGLGGWGSPQGAMMGRLAQRGAFQRSSGSGCPALSPCQHRIVRMSRDQTLQSPAATRAQQRQLICPKLQPGCRHLHLSPPAAAAEHSSRLRSAAGVAVTPRAAGAAARPEQARHSTAACPPGLATPPPPWPHRRCLAGTPWLAGPLPRGRPHGRQRCAVAPPAVLAPPAGAARGAPAARAVPGRPG